MNHRRSRRTVRYARLASVILAGVVLLINLYIDRSLNAAIFYLIPVTLATWYVSRTFALGIAFVSAVAWLILETTVQPPAPLRVAPYWNAFSMLASFALFTVVLTQLKYRLDVAERRATFDDLTQLPNRFAFRVLAEQEVRKRHHQGPTTMVYLDLDNFKAVNDSRGHAVGDDLLRTVDRTLQDNLRGTDVVARLGGDVFIIILPDTSRSQAEPLL